jgi:hypothetical protein
MFYSDRERFYSDSAAIRQRFRSDFAAERASLDPAAVLQQYRSTFPQQFHSDSVANLQLSRSNSSAIPQ